MRMLFTVSPGLGHLHPCKNRSATTTRGDSDVRGVRDGICLLAWGNTVGETAAGGAAGGSPAGSDVSSPDTPGHVGVEVSMSNTATTGLGI